MQLTIREAGRKMAQEIYAGVDADLGWKAQMKKWKEAAAQMPSRAAMDAGPPTDCTEIEVGKLAKSSCRACSGKGYRLVADVRKDSKANPVPCSCAEKGYQKFMAKRITMPCRICGTVGWCEHRPRTLQMIFQDLFVRSMAQVLAAGGSIPKALQSDILRHALFGGAPDAKAPKKSGRQDKRGPGQGPRGQEGPDAGSTGEGQSSVLPGLQPGSGDA